ncbi:MAG: hypothetical protein J3Q66DRAFT_344462 [Benniella sp.]|nr:MAG: hypothetical protein J3Q66DRAFT_344462 [Benniella sp.]
MDLAQLSPLLMQFLEEHGTPVVQEKVTEEVDETKVELKQDLPGQVQQYADSDDAHPMVKQANSVMGDKFSEHVKSLTTHTVDVASEGMDTILTGGVMNIAKDIVAKVTEGKSMAELEVMKHDKENMIKHTMAAAVPIIKQVAKNLGSKISEHLPASIGGRIQEWIDDHGGDHGVIGFAAGLMGKIMGGDDDDDDDGDTPEVRAQKKAALEKAGVRTGKMQRIVTSILGPKIADYIIPHIQKFEEKMHNSLEGELRNKLFSIDYIKSKALSMIAASGGILGTLAGALGGKIAGGGDDDDDDKSGGGGGGDALQGVLGAFLNKGGDGDGDGDGLDMKGVLGMASKFLNKED